MSNNPKLATEQQVKDVSDTFTEIINHQGKQIKALESGVIDAIEPGSPAPTKRGEYKVTKVGVYINFKDGNGQPISVTEEDFSTGNVSIIFNGTNSRMLIVPITFEGEVKEGDTRGVSGMTVLNSLKTSSINFKKGYVDKEGKIILRNDVSFQVSEPIEVNEYTILNYRGSVDAGSGVAQALVTYDKTNQFSEVILGGLFNSKEGTVSKRFKPEVGYIVVCTLEKYNKITINNSIVIPSNISGILEYLESTLTSKSIATWEKGYIQSNGFNSSQIYENWRRTLPVKTKIGDIFIFKGRTQADEKKPSDVPSIYAYDELDNPLYPLLGNYLSSKSFIFRIEDPRIYSIRANAISLYDFVLNKVTSDQSIIPINGNWCSIGDSITYIDGVNNFKGYQTFVKNKISFIEGFENRGYSGLGLVDDNDRGSILLNIKNITSFDFYSIFAGTNDFRLDHPLGKWEDYLNKTGSQTFYGALREIIDLLYTKNSKASILLITPLRRNNSGYTSFSINNAGYTLGDIKEAIMKVGNYEALPVIDYYNYSGITDRNLDKYTSDGLHPTEEGHELISSKIVSFFSSQV